MSAGFLLSKYPDELLCRRLETDPYAGDVLFRRYIRPVTDFLRRSYSGIDHDDIAVESIVIAINLVTLRQMKTNFKALVFGIAKRVAWKSKQMLQREVLLAVSGEAHALAPSDTIDSVAMVEQVWRAQAVRVLKNAISTLTASERAVFILFYVDGITTPEIAKQLQISNGAVRCRLSEARKRIKANPTVVAFCKEYCEGDQQ